MYNRTNSTLRHISSALLALSILIPSLQAQTEKIAARPLTPREVNTYEIPAETLTSGGLFVVGVGEPIYLEAQMPTNAVVSAVEWAVVATTTRDSASTFLDSPVSADIPIFSQGDAAVNSAWGRVMFIPDQIGTYTIEATVTTADGPTVLTQKITSAEYVGVGTMGGTNPEYPQCALCHEEQSLNYMETAHAGAFTRGIDGISTNHFQERCISCHSLGLPSTMENGNFFDVAAETGWEFPTTLEVGNWDAMPDTLKAKANVQCESCHGAGSLHHGDKTTTSVTLDAGDCGKCHDAEPYHTKNSEWDLSRHAVATRYPTGENRESCVRCHSGWGFIDYVDGKETPRTEYEAITCAVCHDPHDGTNPHQVREIADVELMNGEVITEGGTGKLCMNCHMSRRDGETYSDEYHRRYGPHYGPQSDMLAGTNAAEFGKEIPSTGHLYALEDACASCHMASVASDNPANHLAGGHTFKPVWDGGTPDDMSDDVDMVGACTECHGNIDSFDFKRTDLNNDGKVEGVQTEVGKMMKALALKLPPLGEDKVSVAEDYTPAQLKAAFNYLFIEEDKSHGIHNTSYTVGLIKASVGALAGPQNDILEGENVPVGGDWFYSPWFGFYTVEGIRDGWVYSWEQGTVHLAGDSANLYYYDRGAKSWFYTNNEMYPYTYSYRENAWLYYDNGGTVVRWFYNVNTSSWKSFFRN